MRLLHYFSFAILFAIGLTAQPAKADESDRPPMTTERLDALVRAVDPEANREDNLWSLRIEDRPVTVVADPGADRMRIVVPIADAATLDASLLYRVLQANFDSTIDARYAIARGALWGAFIHPLGPLTDDEFLSGLGQVINIASSFGTTYSSGLLTFGPGDSADILRRQLIEELLKKGEQI
jgi:hypothetical protein